MRARLASSILGLSVLLFAFSVSSAQTSKQPVTVTARTSADASPDLSGVWTLVQRVRRSEVVHCASLLRSGIGRVNTFLVVLYGP